MDETIQYLNYPHQNKKIQIYHQFYMSYPKLIECHLKYVYPRKHASGPFLIETSFLTVCSPQGSMPDNQVTNQARLLEERTKHFLRTAQDGEFKTKIIYL